MFILPNHTKFLSVYVGTEKSTYIVTYYREKYRKKKRIFKYTLTNTNRH